MVVSRHPPRPGPDNDEKAVKGTCGCRPVLTIVHDGLTTSAVAAVCGIPAGAKMHPDLDVRHHLLREGRAAGDSRLERRGPEDRLRIRP
jgi:hypothetical protein